MYMAKKKTARKSSGGGVLGVYSNLAYKKRVKSDRKSRKKAEELAKLPKQPVARFFAKLRPDRVFHFWFSKDGLDRRSVPVLQKRFIKNKPRRAF